MATGVSTTRANAMLDTIATPHVKLHTGDPGAAGTSNASSEATRKSITLTAAATAERHMSASVSWTGWTQGSQTITHVSVWDNISAGTFQFSVPLTNQAQVNNGETFTLQTLTISILSIAA
jgi:hypothetical protein